MATTTSTTLEPTPSPDIEHGDSYIHIVSTWTHLRDLIGDLTGYIPRALCGVRLDSGSGCPEPRAGAPLCPTCKRIDAGEAR